MAEPLAVDLDPALAVARSRERTTVDRELQNLPLPSIGIGEGDPGGAATKDGHLAAEIELGALNAFGRRQRHKRIAKPRALTEAPLFDRQPGQLPGGGRPPGGILTEFQAGETGGPTGRFELGLARPPSASAQSPSLDQRSDRRIERAVGFSRAFECSFEVCGQGASQGDHNPRECAVEPRKLRIGAPGRQAMLCGFDRQHGLLTRGERLGSAPGHDLEIERRAHQGQASSDPFRPRGRLRRGGQYTSESRERDPAHYPHAATPAGRRQQIPGGIGRPCGHAVG